MSILSFLGFGKGKIEIQIDKYNFSPGNVLNGKVLLKLKKPIKAKSLKIALKGEKTTYETEYRDNRPTTSKNITSIFDFTQPLDTEKEYPTTETDYNFKIKIPKNILSQSTLPENPIANTIAKSLQILSNQDTKIGWYLIAFLEIPWGIDVSKKVQINIV